MRLLHFVRNDRLLNDSLLMPFPIIPNPVAIAELAVEKGAVTLLMPISSMKQLFNLSDEMATKVSIEFYADPADSFLKAVLE